MSQSSREIRLSVVIPTYNEEKRLPRTFDALRRLKQSGVFKDLEIIFVNDSSTDRTAELIRDFGRSMPLKQIDYSPNRGKGYAVRQGFLAAGGDYVLMTDADLSTDLLQVSRFEEYMKMRLPVIIGTRRGRGSRISVHQPLYRESMGYIYTKIASIITGVTISDFTCGFKCLSRKAAREIFSRAAVDRWSFDAEVLFLAKRLNFKIAEVPVTWRHETGSAVRVFKDMWRSLADLVLIRWRALQGKYR